MLTLVLVGTLISYLNGGLLVCLPTVHGGV